MIIKSGVLRRVATSDSSRVTEFEVVTIEGTGWKETFVNDASSISDSSVYSGSTFEENYEDILDNTGGPYTYEWTYPLTQVDTAGGSSVLDVYPVGIEITTNDTAFNPNNAWGGTWTVTPSGSKRVWKRTA